MSSKDDESLRLDKFKGRRNEDYATWPDKIEIVLKGKGLWKKIKDDNCQEELRDKATSIIALALGEAPFRVCRSAKGNPMEMLELFDARYASKRSVSWIALLHTICTKKHKGKEDLAKFVDEFDRLFSQFEQIKPEVNFPDEIKVGLFMASLQETSSLKSSLASLKLQDDDKLTWETVTSDLIEVWNQQPEAGRTKQDGEGSSRTRKKKSRNAHGAQVGVCSFCGETHGNPGSGCFWNPANPNNKLPKALKKKLASGAETEPEEEADKRKKKKSLRFGSMASRVKNGAHPKFNKVANKKQASNVNAVSANKTSEENHKTLLDSGASDTFFKSKQEVEDGSYVKGSEETVTIASGSESINCMGSGTFKIGKLKLPGLHLESCNNTLVSVGQICDLKKIVVFTEHEAVVLSIPGFEVDESHVDIVAKRNMESGLYEIERPVEPSISKAAYNISNRMSLWHNRLAHANVKVLQKLSNHVKDVKPIKGNLQPCTPCKLGKAKKKSFSSHFEATSYPGEIVHSDISGPHPLSLDDRKYFVTFMDQHTRFVHVMGLEAKSEVAESFELYKKCGFVKKYFPRGVQRLHSDGGGEYLKVNVPESSMTTPATPQHNPFAERVNLTLMDPVRVMLEQSGLSSKYWEYALDHTAYIKNRITSSALNCTPYEALTGKKPTLKYVRVFGCAAFVLNPDPKSKVHAKALPGIFLGCDDNGVYMIELLKERKLINSVHVTFDEDEFPALENPGYSSSDESASGSDKESTSGTASSDNESQVSVSMSDENQAPTENVESDSTSAEENEQESEEEIEEPENPTGKRYPARSRKATEKYGYAGSAKVIKFPITTTDMPTVKEAMSATPPERELWIQAIVDELNSLESKGTWSKVSKEIAKKEAKSKVLPTHVVLKVKRDENGLATRFKARIVAGGHLQVIGKDVEGVYAPVVDYSIALLTLAIAKQLNWKTSHLDVKTAFLNGDIDRETYVSHPYNLPSHLKSGNYYKLDKALYGLRQAPLRWFVKLRDTLTKELGYKQLKSDGSVFYKKFRCRGEASEAILLCYVDDLIFVSSTSESLEEICSSFLKVFEGNKEPLHWYLAVKVDELKNKLVFSQEAYINQCLETFNLADMNPQETPMQGNFYDAAKVHNSDPVIEGSDYASLIGALQFLVHRTRPDIATAVGILSQYTSRPSAFLLKAVKRVFAYLKATSKFGLLHVSDTKPLSKSQIKIEFLCDSDHAGELENRKSRTGYIGYVNGCAFIWKSTKQKSTAKSTAESEYIALSDCAQEISRIRLFLAELDFTMNKPIPLYSDNVAAQKWADDDRSMRRAKHLELRYHYIREKVQDGTIKAYDIQSAKNPADGFTKPLDKVKFQAFRNQVGVCSLGDTKHQEE